MPLDDSTLGLTSVLTTFESRQKGTLRSSTWHSRSSPQSWFYSCLRVFFSCNPCMYCKPQNWGRSQSMGHRCSMQFHFGPLCYGVISSCGFKRDALRLKLLFHHLLNVWELGQVLFCPNIHLTLKRRQKSISQGWLRGMCGCMSI